MGSGQRQSNPLSRRRRNRLTTGSLAPLCALACALRGQKSHVTLYGYPAWIRTKNNASKGRCVTVTPRGNRLADLRFSTAQRKLQLGGTNNSRFCRQRSPLGHVRQPGAVALQSKSGTRLLFPRFGQANVNRGAAAVYTGKRNF